MRKLLVVVLALALACTAVPPAPGTVRGVISEGITPLPGVTVTLVDARGVARSVVTDLHGAYVITGVAPGAYTVIAELKGLKTSSVAVRVSANRTAVADLSMSFASVSEAITVTGTRRGGTTSRSSRAMARGADLDGEPKSSPRHPFYEAPRTYTMRVAFSGRPRSCGSRVSRIAAAKGA